VSTRFDAIVIGSGIGGLACAAALARHAKRVLVLEQHYVAGGFTHTFERQGFTWDVGVHYLGRMGPGQPVRRVLDWLSGGTIEFASMGEVYDVAQYPDAFRFAFRRPAQTLVADLKQAFPASEADIDRWFATLSQARAHAQAPFVLHSVPKPAVPLIAWLKREGLRKWWGRTTAEVLCECISDPRLRAVLATQWGDYGTLPSRSSFGMHATLVDHYLEGGWYPVGGATAFARGLIPVIEAAGGAVRVGADVVRVLIEAGRAVGVELADGSRERARHVVSDAGVHTTLTALLPPEWRESEWGREVLGFEPSASLMSLYL